jgi:PAS domain S-box-containing protein
MADLARASNIRLTGVWAVLAGVASGLAAVLGKALLVETVGDPGNVLLLAGVIVAAWIGGIVGGLVALLVTAAIPILEAIAAAPTSDGGELFRQASYLVVATGTVLLIGSRRAARDRLADALQDAASLAQQVDSRDQRLQLVLDASRTGFWEWDVGSGALEWSDTIFRQHGLEPGGRAPDYETYLESIHPEDREHFEEAIRSAFEGGGTFELEFRVVWPDASVHWTHAAGRVFRGDGGRPVRMVGTGQDITERRGVEDERDRLLEEERRAREFREAFVDVVSHELRTPITTILGLTEILARPGRPENAETRRALLDDVRAEAERLHRLVEDLLVLSRVEHGRLEVEAEPIELRRLIERIVAWEAAELPSIVISLHLEPYLPIVAGEATYVEQIIRNLLNNAAKYTPSGTGVEVSARSEDDTVAIRVSDDGPGIPDASVERAFELFYRDPASARSVSGSGIGLFVCASLVRAMGGRIWALRRPEGGSEFGFTLKAIEADDELLATVETAAPETVP